MVIPIRIVVIPIRIVVGVLVIVILLPGILVQVVGENSDSDSSAHGSIHSQ